MTERATCYERDEALCEDQMCLRTGCRLRNERIFPMNDREELKVLADREAAARRRYNETDEALIRESKLIEGALRLASQPSAAATKATLEALSMWCTSERLKLRNGFGGFDNQSEREIGIGIVERELDRRAAAIDALVPADGVRELRAALKEIVARTYSSDRRCRLGYESVADICDIAKAALAQTEGGKSYPFNPMDFPRNETERPSEATPAPAFGCKRAGGFVDSSCCAPCDCDKTMRLTQPDPADDAAVAEWQSRFKTSWGWTKWYNIDLPIDVFRRIRRGTISTGAMEIRPLYTHPAKAVDTLTPDELQSLTSLADGMGFGRTHDALRKLLAALLNAGPGQTGGK